MPLSRPSPKPGPFNRPQSLEELTTVSPENRIYYVSSIFDALKVARIAPGVVVKCLGEHTEEIACTQFALRETTLPIPQILAYPPGEDKWYYCMEEIPGTSLEESHRFAKRRRTRPYCHSAKTLPGRNAKSKVRSPRICRRWSLQKRLLPTRLCP